MLSSAVQKDLHPYLGGVLNEIDCPAIKIGGERDHVHLLFGISRTFTIAQVTEKVKTSSSKWLKAREPRFGGFHWQHGYGAFSVSQSDVEKVIAYIRNQEEHHRKMTFQEEYRKLLERYRIQYDERYVWD